MIAETETPPQQRQGWHDDERDHRARERRQWFYIRILTAVAAIGASGSAILSLLALLSSQEAARLSRRTATEAIETSKDTEFTQLRAYLYVRHHPIDAQPSTARAQIDILHSGATPAYKIRLDAMLEVGGYLTGDLQLPDVTSHSVEPVDRSAYSILYSTEYIPKTISLPADAAEAMRLVRSSDPAIGDQRLYLHGVVRYFDIFGLEGRQPEHRYEFCFVYHPDRDRDGGERGCEKYNQPG